MTTIDRNAHCSGGDDAADGGRQFHGSSVCSSWFLVRPETIRRSTSVSQAKPFSLQGWIILSRNGHRPYGRLDDIGVLLQAAIVEIPDLPMPMAQSLPNGFGQIRPSRHARQAVLRPKMQILDQRSTSQLTNRLAHIRRLATMSASIS